MREDSDDSSSDNESDSQNDEEGEDKLAANIKEMLDNVETAKVITKKEVEKAEPTQLKDSDEEAQTSEMALSIKKSATIASEFAIVADDSGVPRVSPEQEIIDVTLFLYLALSLRVKSCKHVTLY